MATAWGGGCVGWFCPAKNSRTACPEPRRRRANGHHATARAARPTALIMATAGHGACDAVNSNVSNTPIEATRAATKSSARRITSAATPAATSSTSNTPSNGQGGTASSSLPATRNKKAWPTSNR